MDSSTYHYVVINTAPDNEQQSIPELFKIKSGEMEGLLELSEIIPSPPPAERYETICRNFGIPTAECAPLDTLGEILLLTVECVPGLMQMRGDGVSFTEQQNYVRSQIDAMVGPDTENLICDFILNMFSSCSFGSTDEINCWLEYINACSAIQSIGNGKVVYIGGKFCNLEVMCNIINVNVAVQGNSKQRFIRNFDNESVEGYAEFFAVQTFPQLAFFSLSEIFKSGKVIKECAYCHRLFVPQKRNNEKYCRRKNSNNKLCSQLARAKKQAAEKGKAKKDTYALIKQLRKSRRAVWQADKNMEPEELERLLSEDSSRYHAVKRGECGKDEYQAWLRSTYKRKPKIKF